MDKISPAQRSENMRRIKDKNMKPEVLVRHFVHGMGYRYRLHRKNLPGKPDLVFNPRKKVIFVHGCFWHQHPDPNCSDSRLPKSNRSYWHPKLFRNVERDTENVARLEVLGWDVLVIWECETGDIENQRDRIVDFLGSRGMCTSTIP
jgi:DNA mismatch endonuclease (patch repair protein)